MTNELESQISAAIKESGQFNRVRIVETSATTAQINTVLQSLDMEGAHCDWVSWHEQDDEYQTDCWYVPVRGVFPADPNPDWRITIKHSR